MCTWACRSKVTMEKHRFSRKYCSWRHSKAPPTRNAIMFGLRMSSVVQKMCTTPRVTMHTKRTCHTNRSPLFTQFVLQVCARWKIKGSYYIKLFSIIHISHPPVKKMVQFAEMWHYSVTQHSAACRLSVIWTALPGALHAFKQNTGGAVTGLPP